MDGGAVDVVALDQISVDGTTLDQTVGDEGLGDETGGAADARPFDGAASDGDAMAAPFPCAVCMTHWVCSGGGDAGTIPIDLVLETDGCYLSGLPGHKLLAPDGSITENGTVVATALKFGPQVGVNYPDGQRWLYCGTSPFCP